MSTVDFRGTDDIWRLAITHRTVVVYPEPVTTSYNEVRMQPADEPGQAVLSSYIEIDPFEGMQYYTDYFGNRVAAFDVHRPHRELTVTSATTVETFRPSVAPPPGLDWDGIAASGCDDFFEEYLASTPLTALDDELHTIAAHLKDGDPAATGRAVCDWVHRTLAYEQGTTSIHTSAIEAYRDRRGVCQDLSHLAIGMLRCLGIPTRYVSGYLHPDAEAAVGQTVLGESHAWIEFWDGRWNAFDPTNAQPTGLGHVVAGRGRDYADTPPIRGVYAGPDAIDNQVTVQITRLR
jgi:transglutaminase-like putative cysteine protease